MKFFGMNMADALLLASAAFILFVAVALVYVAMTLAQGEPLTIALIGLGAVFAVLALKLVKRVLVNPLPIFEEMPDTSYRRKSVE
jgi:hypothetical protein